MNSVLKGASYVLVHAPDMLIHNGTTQTTERIVNPDSEYLKALPNCLRTYNQAAAYAPNQVYIGNMHPDELKGITEESKLKSVREGAMGEIMPQDEFYMLMQCCDVFDLVKLEKAFADDVKKRFVKNKLLDESVTSRIKEGIAQSEIEDFVKNKEAEGLYNGGKLIGCVTKAHEVDKNLSAHILHENLVSKSSCALSLLHLIRTTGIDKNKIDYVIDCSEEAVGDMNQRGGGNMAKAAAEIAGFVSASGADVRAFCAAPVHAVIHAAALVSSGTYNNVVVAAGGSTAKLGMNGKDHIKKGLLALEDVLGGFAVLISKNDGESPEILSQYTGKHNVGSGSAPQNVITALVSDPLDKMGIKIVDIDKYSAEMQNPDITKPAGAGDVPLANFKMIAALAVKRGEMERTAIDGFIEKHGMPGWAPTQGHIPSGVPFLGFARKDILNGKIKNCMIVGKGSLFLGRMTNCFDGVSVIIQKNSGASRENGGISEKEIRNLIAGAMRDFAITLGGKPDGGKGE